MSGSCPLIVLSVRQHCCSLDLGSFHSWLMMNCCSRGKKQTSAKTRQNSWKKNRRRPSLVDKVLIKGGSCLAQRKHSCFPTRSPWFESRLPQDYLSFLLSLWTVLRLYPSSAKQWISQTQLKVPCRVKH